ncbi:hypothetical protein G7Y89_g2373 [Cudoniella acicularis]|uniref:RTA1-domain-containing protein n=1 Tax=Cudoniella acicularis TaxID=354080 RepID=A0A8H4RWF0_9HELO|nr:hypothetical protein G7Y89_g2373 [Cudoniella acicularis]
MAGVAGRYPNGTYHGNITLLEYPRFCTLQTCDLTLASFDYRPTLAGNALIAGIFAIFIFGQIFYGIKHKIWGYMGAILFGLFLECLGYIARVMIYNNPFNHNMFLMYLILLTIAPAFLTAGIYLCLARIVIVYGEHLSRFLPRTYTFIFCTCDFVSLVLQGAGGGIASTSNTTSGTNLGKNLMLAGLVFQVVSLVLFAICCGEFGYRVLQNKGNRNPKHTLVCSSTIFKAFLWGLFIASLTITIRSTYRCVELAGGFQGELFRSDEPMFMILEAVMIVIATACLTFLHPGEAFQGAWHEATFNYFPANGSDKNERSSSDEENGNVELINVSGFKK